MVGGLMLPMEELLITNGALEALNLCLQAVTQPGDLVAIEARVLCLQVLERLKLKAVEIPVHPRQGMDLDAFAQTLDKHPVKAVWCMTNFQNPVGASMPEANKGAGTTLARHQVPLIEDDVYAELYRAAGTQAGQGIRHPGAGCTAARSPRAWPLATA